jgi:hypothetical protein
MPRPVSISEMTQCIGRVTRAVGVAHAPDDPNVHGTWNQPFEHLPASLRPLVVAAVGEQRVVNTGQLERRLYALRHQAHRADGFGPFFKDGVLGEREQKKLSAKDPLFDTFVRYL